MCVFAKCVCVCIEFELLSIDFRSGLAPRRNQQSFYKKQRRSSCRVRVRSWLRLCSHGKERNKADSVMQPLRWSLACDFQLARGSVPQFRVLSTSVHAMFCSLCSCPSCKETGLCNLSPSSQSSFLVLWSLVEPFVFTRFGPQIHVCCA